MSATTQDRDAPRQTVRAHSAATERIGLIVAGSLAGGLLAACALVAAPIVEERENQLIGVLLLGFAFGWVLLAVLSVRFTAQPQRWAVAPAAFMGIAGVVSLTGSDLVRAVFAWVWPPVLLTLVGWMIIRARRNLPSPARQWLLYPVLGALAVASVGGGYETVRESLDARAYPLPGQLVDVGGHRLHLHCTGSGSPTVVLEPGFGAASSDLAWIAPAVARDSRVCVYDRAGRGWSDAASGPQDGNQIALDLHTLLDRAHVPGPYVLAGHSFGGLYVLSFAAHFPDEVAGLVLLDSTAPKAGPSLPTNTDSSSVLGRVSALLPAVAHLGAGRLLALSSYDSLPPRSRDEARANASTARSLGSSIEEFIEGSPSMQQAAAVTNLDGKPLIVLTADTGHDAEWQSAQDHLATLSSNSQHRVADATSHESLVGNEADSAAASKAILDVVTAVRTSHPLR